MIKQDCPQVSADRRLGVEMSDQVASAFVEMHVGDGNEEGYPKSALSPGFGEGGGRLPRSPPMHSLRSGLDHRHDAGLDGGGESIPGGHDGGQFGVRLTGVVDTGRRKRWLMW